MIGVAGARQQGEPLLVVAQRVDFKWSATGRLLGWLGAGAPVEKLAGKDGWSRVQVRGWVPATSLDPAATRYRVRPFEEPLREEPGGAIRGGLRRGAEVGVLRRSDAWVEVEVVGWLPDPSVASAPAGGAAAPAAAPSPSAPPPSAGNVGLLTRAVEIAEAPAGRALAALAQGTVVTAEETRAGWTRVTVQGWVPSSAVPATAAAEVAPEIVAAAAPDAFAGRATTWTVEHVSLQRADRLRSDFREGELFDLARAAGPAGSAVYVYLVVPDRLAEEFRSLAPFATLRVVGKVRTGRSALTGNPVLEVEQILP